MSEMSEPYWVVKVGNEYFVGAHMRDGLGVEFAWTNDRREAFRYSGKFCADMDARLLSQDVDERVRAVRVTTKPKAKK